jgi:hypothetical protein
VDIISIAKNECEDEQKKKKKKNTACTLYKHNTKKATSPHAPEEKRRRDEHLDLVDLDAHVVGEQEPLDNVRRPRAVLPIRVSGVAVRVRGARHCNDF